MNIINQLIKTFIPNKTINCDQLKTILENSSHFIYGAKSHASNTNDNIIEQINNIDSKNMEVILQQLNIKINDATQIQKIINNLYQKISKNKSDIKYYCHNYDDTNSAILAKAMVKIMNFDWKVENEHIFDLLMKTIKQKMEKMDVDERLNICIFVFFLYMNGLIALEKLLILILYQYYKYPESFEDIVLTISNIIIMNKYYKTPKKIEWTYEILKYLKPNTMKKNIYDNNIKKTMEEALFGDWNEFVELYNFNQTYNPEITDMFYDLIVENMREIELENKNFKLSDLNKCRNKSNIQSND